MLKNPYHIHGPSGLLVPVHLNFGDYVLEKLWGFKDKVALIDAASDECTTYSEIVQHSMNFAISLARMGVRKGDVVGLMSENRKEYWGSVIGAACTGATVATISPSYKKDELNHAINISKPKFLICSPFAYKSQFKTIKTFVFVETIIIYGNERIDNTILYQDLAVNVKEQVKYEDFKSADVNGETDTLFNVYSSGTTGLPKGVMLTHLNIITACCQPLSHDPTEMTLSVSPWYHVMGLVGFFTGSVTGSISVYIPKFDVDLYLKIIQKYKISQLVVVPPVLVAVCKWPGNYDLSSVKLICAGAAPLPKKTVEAVYQKFPNLHEVPQIYGASETTFAVMKFMLSESDEARRRPGSVGKVVHAMTAKVIDGVTGKAVGPNQCGEICIKGAMLMKGYVGIGRGDDFDDEGFYKMGDVGYYDDEGFFYVVDRLKELIKYKGFQVPPAELESLLLCHTAVKDVGVIGIPHESGGEVPLAFIALQNGRSVTEKELQQYVAERISNPKHLRGGVRFVDQIPKSPSGKILRKDLRELFKAGNLFNVILVILLSKTRGVDDCGVTWPVLKDIVRNPPATGKYEKLKQELIKRLSISREHQITQLLSHEELGDRKPSQFSFSSADGVTWSTRLRHSLDLGPSYLNLVTSLIQDDQERISDTTNKKDLTKMLKNPNHIHGPSGLLVPVHLNFGDYVLEKLWGFKDKVAMINAATDECTTYSEIVQHSINFAISLARMGVRKGDVVGLMSENRKEYWGSVIGAACTGAAVATISPSYMKDELKNAINISKPKILICSPFTYKNHAKTINTFAFLEKIIIYGNERIENTILYQELAVNVTEQVKYEDFKSADVNGQTDTLFIVYSSGTTGLPKGVMLTHLNIITACCLPLSHDPSEMTLSVSPWYHVMGLAGFLTASVTGRTGVFMTKFDVDLYLKTIEKYKISQLVVVPPVLVAVCKWPGNYDLSSVKLIYSGAAPLPKDTIEAVYQKFPNLHAVLQGYGASETTLGVIKFMFTEIDAARSRPGSVGKVVHEITAKVTDGETGKTVGPNHRGEICIKGAMLMKGYVGIGRGDDFDDEGFYKTGDVGYYDDEGFFYVVDRLKELIKYKGFQVPPAELESLLLGHSAVKDVGVIGIPHESGGEVPLAFIALQNGRSVTEKEFQEYVAERLSNPKHLRGGVRFVDQIPKSPSGKILRKELRELFRAGRSKL